MKTPLWLSLIVFFSASAVAQSPSAIPETNPASSLPLRGLGWTTDVRLPPNYNLSDVQSLQLMPTPEDPEDAVPWLRAQTLQETALAFGMQAGLAKTVKLLNDVLEKRRYQYDTIYDFSAVMLEPGLVPPVIVEARNTYKQTGETQARATDRTFRIERSARLVNTPPRWDEYLVLPLTDPEMPHASLLPSTPAERRLWDTYVTQGWKEGESQAKSMFEDGFARLNRDFVGMVRYKMLYEQGVVSKPELAHSTLGITGGGTELAINDRIVEITVPAQLDPNAERWMQSLPTTHASDKDGPAMEWEHPAVVVPSPPVPPPHR